MTNDAANARPDDVPPEVLAAFALAPGAAVAPLPSGHINRTFLARDDTRALVLQWINGHVFPDPANLCRNTLAVTRHVRTRAALVPEQFTTRGGEASAVDARGAHWRATAYVPAARTLTAAATRQEAAAAAAAFGRFSALTDDFDTRGFVPAIVGFHDLAPRLERFDAVRAADAHDRARGATDVLDAIAALRTTLVELPFAALPQRLIHADCKIGNVLFEADGPSVRAVVDLDTVMVATPLFDFADLARSVCAIAPEDEQDTARVGIQEGHLAAIARAYFAARAAPPTSQERALRVPACAYIAFMLGVRFASDHLDGDAYFAIQRVGQNLDRARAQLRMAGLYWHGRERLAALLDDGG